MHPGLSALVIHDLKNRLAIHEQRLSELAVAHADLSAELHPLRTDALALHRRLIAFLTLYRDDTYGLCVNEREEVPAHVLAQAARVAWSHIAGRSVTVEVDALAGPASWFFDSYLIGLALEAAVENAARYASRHIRLFSELHTESGSQILVLGIEDDGPGLDADVFGSTHCDVGIGSGCTGLGTELCRTVARLHGCDGRHGEVRLTDRAEGGARFEMRLP